MRKKRKKKHRAELDLRQALKQEELMWSRKAREAWRTGGDKCTRYFHRLVQSRVASNNISQLKIDGRTFSDPKILTDHIEAFFQNLYTEDVPDRPSLKGIKLKTLDAAAAITLDQPFIEVEMVNAHNNLVGEKALGSDGFSMRFYKTCWAFLKDDLLRVVDDFCMNNFFDWRLNTTFISLIPKEKGPKIVNDLLLAKLLADVKFLNCSDNCSGEEVNAE